MCAACVEYAKEKLTMPEFRSALREASMDNPAHQKQVEQLIEKYAEKPAELRELVKPLPGEVKDY